jgi:hypothetical protein
MGDAEPKGDLPPGLQAFVDAAIAALGPTLRAVVLFGSGAEGRLRATSDVNLMLVLRAFDIARMDALREPLRLATAGLHLAPMLILEQELEIAATAFAMKFMDIGRRHRVLFGDDPFASLVVPRAAAVTRLRQVLLNLLLRLRERYASESSNEERLALVLASVAGPLRTAAATLLTLEGDAAPAPREALERVTASLGGEAFAPALRVISEVRETGRAAPGAARQATLALLELISQMLARTLRLVTAV